MRNLLASLLLLAGVGTYALAQSSPRMPVILSDRGTDEPQPAPDPSGVYSGSVTFTLGTQGSFTQTWRIPIKAQPCTQCEIGQYVLTSTDYALTTYNFGTERGSVWGVVNNSGDAFLELRAVNCPFLSLGLGGASFFHGGSLGPAPGQPLRIANGLISGRLSGYDCFGQLIVANLSLHKEPGAQPRTCPYFGGYYFGSYANSCGGSASGYAILTQSGCAISGYSAGARSAIDVTITSPTTATFKVNFTDGCSGTASGNAQISGGVITGTYSGTSEGGAGCCLPGPVSGSFTLTPP